MSEEKKPENTPAPAAPAAAKPAAPAAAAPAAAKPAPAPKVPPKPQPMNPKAVERMALPGLGKRVMDGLGSLLKGMGITFGYFSRPSTVVTQQYPENRATLKMPDRFRAQLSMIHDENGFHKCTACHICEQACPNASIHVLERPKPAAAKTELDTFVWRLDSCTFCNLCVLVCPFQCLKMNPTFESSVYDQRLLVMNLTQYAGPTSTVLMKTADPEERKKLIEPRSVYDGPTSLNGESLAGISSGGAPSAPAEAPASTPLTAPKAEEIPT